MNIEIQVIDNWFVICADKDWVLDNIENIEHWDTVFKRLMAIPEWGVNSIRSEVLLYTFAVYIENEIENQTIKDKSPNDEVEAKVKSNLPFRVYFKR